MAPSRMIRIAARAALPALVVVAFAPGTASAQSQRSGIESAPLLPPAGFGPSAGQSAQPAPEPRNTRPARPPVPPQLQQQPAPPPPAAATTPAPDGEMDGMIVQPPAQKISNAYATFFGLDKITGRITTFDVAIGETAQFGALQVTPRVCYTRPATETQNTTAFAEVNEMTLKGEAKRIFTGWMFAASPGLHGVEHPIYDVWLMGCKASAPVTARPGGQQ